MRQQIYTVTEAAAAAVNHFVLLVCLERREDQENSLAERERAQQTARRPGTGQYSADESLWLLEMGPLLLLCAKM